MKIINTIIIASTILALFCIIITIWFHTTKSKSSSNGETLVDNNAFNLANLARICQVKDWLNTSRAITPEDLSGRIILLDFWTFCCINCIHTIPELLYLEDHFKEYLTVIGVHSAKFANEQDEENIRSAIVRYNITHPVINDKDFVIWNSFDVKSWPTLFLIDPDGNIYSRYSGEGNRDKIKADIQLLIDAYKRTGKKINTSPLPMSLEKEKQPKTVLQFPGKLAYAQDVDAAPALFMSDSGNNRIIAARLDGSVFLQIGQGESGLKDGDFKTAQFNKPQGILWDDPNKKLYIADTQNHALRVADLTAKTVTTLAGNGKRGGRLVQASTTPLTTSLASPWDLAFFPTNTIITIAMAGTHQLWTYNITTQSLDILAGNGVESITDGSLPYNTLSQPSGLATYEQTLYFVDSESSSLRRLKDGTITTLVGTGLFDFGLKDGIGKDGRLQHPLGLCVDDNKVYIADSYNHAIRHYDIATQQLTTFCGNGTRGDSVGTFIQTRFNEPNGMISVGDQLFVTDTNNHRIVVLNKITQQSSVLPVTLTREESKQTIATTLPNLKQRQTLAVAAQTPLTCTLNFQPGYGVNDQAPSWMALFDEQGVLIKKFGTQELIKNSIDLGTLNNNASYRFQGTLYFCKHQAGAACLVHSVDFTLQAHEGNEMKNIEITVTEQG